MTGLHLKSHRPFYTVIIAFFILYASKSSADMINISPGARANGMGEAMVAVVDPMSAYSNPGTMGLYAFEKNISFATTYSRWLPSFKNQNLEIDYQHYFAGISFDVHDSPVLKRIALGVEHHNFYFNLGEREIRSQYNEYLGTEERWEKSRSTIISLGLKSIVEVGIGIGYQRAAYKGWESMGVFMDDAYDCAWDWGVIGRLPFNNVLRILPGIFNGDLLSNYTVNIIQAVAFTRNNIESNDNKYFVNQFNSFGYSIEFEIETKKYPILSFLYSIQDEPDKRLYRRDYSRNSIGREITLLDLFQYRWGYCSEHEVRHWVYSSGYTIKTDGLSNYLIVNAIKSTSDNENIFIKFLKHASLQYSYSIWDAGEGIPLDETEWYEFRISF